MVIVSLEKVKMDALYTQRETPFLASSTVSNLLRARRWFAFDLDDTLHNFRAAAGAAMEPVLAKINSEHGVKIDELRNQYRLILVEKTAAAFVDGRTSREYRKERFEALMKNVQVAYDDDYLEQLADLYQSALSRNLSLKSGAMDLLVLLKAMDKHIVVITEGPEDAQAWTIQQLGIDKHIDFIATTNRFGSSKTDGLLLKVMERLQISAANLVCIGDNWERDIQPAIQADVYAIHYKEGDTTTLCQFPIRVSSLHQLRSLIEAE